MASGPLKVKDLRDGKDTTETAKRKKHYWPSTCLAFLIFHRGFAEFSKQIKWFAASLCTRGINYLKKNSLSKQAQHDSTIPIPFLPERSASKHLHECFEWVVKQIVHRCSWKQWSRRKTVKSTQGSANFNHVHEYLCKPQYSSEFFPPKMMLR